MLAGHSEISKNLRKLGFACVAFEINLGAQYNLLRRDIGKLIRTWLGGGQVLGVWLGTPCTSWSIACRPALRDKQNIWGFAEVPEHRRDTLVLGNRTLRFSCSIIRICIRNRIPCILENPDSSLMFHSPPMIALRRSPAATEARLCMCKFGTPWRKATRLVGWHVNLNSFSNSMCHGRKGVCEFSNRHHIVLQGRDPNSGRTWTSLAGAYPARFARAAALSLAEQNNKTQQALSMLIAS